MSTPVTEGNEIQSKWLSRIKAADEQALRLLYTSNYPNVERYILNNSGSEDDAKDIFQEAFIATWRNIMLDKFTAMHEGSLNGYLFQVAKNKWMDVLRSKKGKKVSIDVAGRELADEMPEALSPDEEYYLEQVKKHFGTMGNPCKALLRKFYFQKESMKQIAAHFSWTEATAKNNKYRCLQKLRAAILTNK